jgi:hypothetical protein
MTMVNNSTSIKFIDNDFDTTQYSVYVQNFYDLTFSGNWYSNYTAAALYLKNVVGASIGVGQMYGSGGGASAIVLGDGTAAGAVSNVGIGGGLVISGGSQGIYVRDYASTVSIGNVSIANMSGNGINANATNISELAISRESIAMKNNGGGNYAWKTPTLTGFGGSATLSGGANDMMGSVFEAGAANTGGTITFGYSHSVAPDCQVTSPNASVYNSLIPGTTSLAIGHPSTSGQQFTWRCQW